jgi:hypothetical protein
MIQLFDLRLSQEAQYTLFKLPGAFAGYYFDERDLLVDRIIDNTIELGIYHRAIVETVVKIQNYFSHIV